MSFLEVLELLNERWWLIALLTGLVVFLYHRVRKSHPNILVFYHMSLSRSDDGFLEIALDSETSRKISEIWSDWVERLDAIVAMTLMFRVNDYERKHSIPESSIIKSDPALDESTVFWWLENELIAKGDPVWEVHRENPPDREQYLSACIPAVGPRGKFPRNVTGTPAEWFELAREGEATVRLSRTSGFHRKRSQTPEGIALAKRIHLAAQQMVDFVATGEQPRPPCAYFCFHTRFPEDSEEES